QWYRNYILQSSYSTDIVYMFPCLLYFFFFFFNDPTPTQIYTLSLHDALPISYGVAVIDVIARGQISDRDRVLVVRIATRHVADGDRKSTRLNSSHDQISYAVFCLKKKK